MLDLKRFRIIDLTREIIPGILTVNGDYLHGREFRRFELRQFRYALDGTLMHWVESETHVGTHVEMPAHYLDGGKSASEMPLETFMGEAVVLRFTELKPIDGKGQPIRPFHLNGVRRGDIVLMWSPYKGHEAPYISPPAARTLAEKKVKLLGVENVRVESSPNFLATHDNLLKNDIPIVEGLVNLDKIRGDRVFYIGLPLNVRGLDSSWIRAVALEEVKQS